MDLLKGLANACWTHNLLTTLRLSSKKTIRQMRPTISRRPSNKNVFLFRCSFPWAKFRKHKAAVKVHTLMDLKGSIPTFIRITDGKVHDVNILDDLILESGAIYIMDRGYLDFARLYTFTQNLSTFITRTKSNFDYHRLCYHKINKTTGLRCDQTIMLNGFYASQWSAPIFSTSCYESTSHN